MGVPRDHQNTNPTPIYTSKVRCPWISTDKIKEDERSRETEKGPMQTPSENSPRISGETKISLKLRVRSKSRDKQIFFVKDNQETITASLTPVCSVTFPNERISFIRHFSFFFFLFSFCILHTSVITYIFR